MTTAKIDGRCIEQFIPPEGVAINFTIASLGSRLGAQFIDFMITTLIVLLLAVIIEINGWLPYSALLILALLVTFLLRIPYYVLSELIWNGRTPGKRMVRIRVININGRRLTPYQIVARNLMKEIDVFLPLSMAFALPQLGLAESIFTGIWMLAIIIIPLANKRRQRLGDMLAGTLVVDNPRTQLLPDLAVHNPVVSKAGALFDFVPAQLEFYGRFELQTLEEVLRSPDDKARKKQIESIVKAIRGKIGYDMPIKSGQEMEFLNAFYLAQREHLETLKLFGTSRENKNYQAEALQAKRNK